MITIIISLESAGNSELLVTISFWYKIGKGIKAKIIIKGIKKLNTNVFKKPNLIMF